uniref:Uncharacterized protein n=1 Tax=Plectus sambesii TaxID=2011161 RepID=A0A914WTN7_9BILA
MQAQPQGHLVTHASLSKNGHARPLDHDAAAKTARTVSRCRHRQRPDADSRRAARVLPPGASSDATTDNLDLNIHSLLIRQQRRRQPPTPPPPPRNRLVRTLTETVGIAGSGGSHTPRLSGGNKRRPADKADAPQGHRPPRNNVGMDVNKQTAEIGPTNPDAAHRPTAIPATEPTRTPPPSPKEGCPPRRHAT